MFYVMEIRTKILLTIYISFLGANVIKSDVVTPVYEWINLEYDYLSPEDRQRSIDAGEFIEGSARISDVDVYYESDDKKIVFVTSPRSVNGVPATLGTVTNKTHNGDPIIAPYPSWDWHRNHNGCPENRITSVFRIMIDECSHPRLWIMDSGFTLSEKCPPQVLAFDLDTNTLIYRYEIPNVLLQSNSVLAGIVADVRNRITCNGTFLYLSDTRGFAIIALDVDRRISERVADRTMFATPDYGILCIEESKFELMDGLQSAALSPYKNGKNRVLFYHALASNTEQWVWTSVLRNWSSVQDSSQFHIYCGRRDTQSSVMSVNKDGIAFFGLASDVSLNCWNTANPYDLKHIHQVYRNQTTLQHISGLKITNDRNGKEELWFANTRASRIQNGPSNDNVINFRIQTADVEQLIKKCSCDKIDERVSSLRATDLQSNCVKCYNGVLHDF